jgi:hypothetical protein
MDLRQRNLNLERTTAMLNSQQVIDKYFLETRCMLIEIAATLDRIDRAQAVGGNGQAIADQRVERIRTSLALLADPACGPNRSEQLLLLFSDPAN